MPISNAIDDCRGRQSANTGDRAQKAYTRVLFRKLIQAFFISSDPFMQSHEQLGQ